MSSLPDRESVPANLKWDLSDIYPDLESWHTDLPRLDSMIQSLREPRGGIATGPEALGGLLRSHDELEPLATKPWRSRGLRHEQDHGESGDHEVGHHAHPE